MSRYKFTPGEYPEDVDTEWTARQVLRNPGETVLEAKRLAFEKTWRTDIDQAKALIYYNVTTTEPVEYQRNERLQDTLRAILREKEWAQRFPYSVAHTQGAWIFYHLTRCLKIKPEVAEERALMAIKMYKSRRGDAWKFAYLTRNEAVTSARQLFAFLKWPRPCEEPADFVTREAEATPSAPVRIRRGKKRVRSQEETETA